MADALNLTGQKFGALTALSHAGRYRRNVVWECRCECGTICKVRASRLKRAETVSCGCGASGGKRKRLTAFGKTCSQSEWAREYGVARVTISKAFRQGEDLEQVLCRIVRNMDHTEYQLFLRRSPAKPLVEADSPI